VRPSSDRKQAGEEVILVADVRSTTGTGIHPKKRISPFWLHFLEMLGAMAIGMFAGAAIFLSIVQLTWEEALIQYPVQSLLVMAVSMTVPMVAWMRHTRHDRERTAEMAAAMVLPVIPFICLVAFDVTKGASCSLYCVTTVLAMLGVMYYRRSDYSTDHS
jgi:O-antigen/teichoic acid export membrane protein